jgi:hypothetical protein
MQAIRIFVEVNSEDISIPELKQFMGKKVEMIILEASSDKSNEKKDQKMKHFFDTAGKIKIDREEIVKLREASKL